MTEQEIIEKLNENNDFFNFGATEPYKTIIKALEKQIAKKPTIEDDFDYGEGYVCTECESFLHYVDDDDEHYRTNYCLHCGTKLDWGNEDAE